MKAVNGTYRDGQVILSESVNWPNGLSVRVSTGAMETDRMDVCVDGSACTETPDAIQNWSQWFDSLEAVFSGDELGRFEDFLASAREEQQNLLPNWQAKVNRLRQ